MMIPINIFFIVFFYRPRTAYAMISGFMTVISCNCGVLLIDWSNALGYEVLQIVTLFCDQKGITENLWGQAEKSSDISLKLKYSKSYVSVWYELYSGKVPQK